MTTLIIVESPTKARAISGYVGPGYRVRATFGHFRDLPEDELGIDVENGFRPHYRVTNRKVTQSLREEIGQASAIILATDPDREGEAIAWHVLDFFRKEIGRKPVVRAEFHEITPQAVRRALDSPRGLDMNLVNAQQARRIMDRLVGYIISPALSREMRAAASAGRVQTAALRLIVERDREIAAFVPEEYWTLDVELSKDNQRFTARLTWINEEKADLRTEADTKRIMDDLDGATYTVSETRVERRLQFPHPPYTTATMQRDAANRLNWSPKKTMQIAQELFEGVKVGDETVGLITYMRTDSVAVAPEAQTEARQVIAEIFGEHLLPEEPPTYRTETKNAQEAHEAIRPTSARRLPDRVASFLSSDQARLYEMIWRRFIASQMKPAAWEVKTVIVDAPGRSATVYGFLATGRRLLDPGFLVAWWERPEDILLPELKSGDRLRFHRFIPERHFTEPPPHFTEASLIKELERRGIGRPSTYATILEAIVRRGYVEKRGKSLHATDFGFRACDLLLARYPEIFALEFTARMEERLDRIAAGAERWQDAVRDLFSRLNG
jgi:DNA topoisomerase-1